MDRIWQWIYELPNSDEWDESNSVLSFEISSSKLSRQSIQLRALKTWSGPAGADEVLTFSLYLLGFNSVEPEKPFWVSDPCPLSFDHPFLPLVLQLIQSIMSRAPIGHVSMCSHPEWKIKPDPIRWFLDTHSPESFSIIFSLIFLSHLFWLCVLHARSEVGSFFFYSLLTPNIELFSSHAPILQTFLVSIGADMELRVMRTLGYMLSKWLILKEVNGVGLQTLMTPHVLRFSYARETHGLWVMKGYAPVSGMEHTSSDSKRNMFSLMDAKEVVLRYGLAHQQLEAVVQLEYSVTFNDGFIMVNTRVDNIRLHVVKLGFGKNEEDAYVDERHFPSRVRVRIGPEVGSSYAASLTLGRSTNNTEREMQVQRILKGRFGKAKVPKVKAIERSSMRMKTKNWRWDQDAEGNTAVLDVTLCDSTTGMEVAKWQPLNGASQGNSFRNRYQGAHRTFTKSGGLVFARDECGEGVGWRLSKDMEGSVLKWRIGCQIWLNYWPNEVESSYSETRCVEWCDEVDLPLIVGK